MRPGIKKGQLCYDTKSGHSLLCTYIQPLDVYAENSMLVYWICRVFKWFKSYEIGGISLVDGDMKFFNIYSYQPIIKYTLEEALSARKSKNLKAIWKLTGV